LTPELRQYVVRPLSKDLAELEALDRMVAIDLLVARSAKEAVAELQAIAADAALPAALRERAAAAVTQLKGGTAAARPRLDAKTLRLPAEADFYVVIDNSALPSMGFLIELGRFSALLSNAFVLDTIKAPSAQDLWLSQCEPEQLTEMPFELARVTGNFRIDQTCAAVRMPRKPGEQPAFTVHSAGQFDPEAIEKLDVKAAADLEVTATGITASGKGLELAPDEARAKALLDLGGFAVRILVPAGSPLLTQMRPFGLPPTESLDVRFAIGTHVRAQATLTMPAGQEVERWQESAQRVLEREVAEKLADAEEHLGLGSGTLALKIAPAQGTLVVSTECAVDKLPKMKQLCRSMLPASPR
jgi:hypothetical protein